MLRVESAPAMNLFDVDDPLSMAIKPPSSESAHEREARVSAELEAKRISDRIDEEIRAEREAKKRQNTEVKVRNRHCLTLSSVRLSLFFRPPPNIYSGVLPVHGRRSLTAWHYFEA